MKSINSTIKTLILSDLFVLSALGLFSPILAIFITQQIKGGDAQVAGFAATFYFAMWIFQVPVGRYLDKRKGDLDDFGVLVAGAFLTSMVPFLFIFASLPWHVYALQAMMGLGRSLVLPPWFAIFTRKVDKERVGFEWSMENVVAGAGLAITGAVGGTLAKIYGFQVVFAFSGILLMLGSAVLIFLYKYLKTKPEVL